VVEREIGVAWKSSPRGAQATLALGEIGGLPLDVRLVRVEERLIVS
jgi:hypothetical protein